MSVKALTLHQPWASLVALLVKRIETRSWSTTYRGRLYIHAGARQVHSGHFLMLARAAVVAGLITREQEQAFRALAVPFGAIVASCELVDVVPIVDRKGGAVDAPTFVATFGRPAKAPALVLVRRGQTPVWTDIEGQRPYGDFTPGRFAWLLEDVRPVDPPVPCRGRQGLWTVPDDVLAQIEGAAA
ncbi:MAG TPA: hypothetical protein VGR26_11540 [Acidimicrobiales bacterium]|nr:hypothetical protein [Acidimicrobiales bacterium]